MLHQAEEKITSAPNVSDAPFLGDTDTVRRIYSLRTEDWLIKKGTKISLDCVLFACQRSAQWPRRWGPATLIGMIRWPLMTSA